MSIHLQAWEEAQDELRDANNRVREVIRKNVELLHVIAAELYGVHPHATVLVRRNSGEKYKPCLVVKIHPDYGWSPAQDGRQFGYKPWLLVRPQNKDGSWSKSEIIAYGDNWKLNVADEQSATERNGQNDE